MAGFVAKGRCRVSRRRAETGGGRPGSSHQIGNRWPEWGLGVQEIRIHTKLEHRIMYVTRLEEAIYVLHAFEKKTRKTGKDDVELARSRLRELLNARRAAGKTRKRK